MLFSCFSSFAAPALKGNKRRCEIAGQHTNDAKAEKHQDDCPSSSKRCHRIVITVANGRNGDESPPDGNGIGGDICMGSPLFKIQNKRAVRDNQYQSNDKGEEQGTLRKTLCEHFSKI